MLFQLVASIATTRGRCNHHYVNGERLRRVAGVEGHWTGREPHAIRTLLVQELLDNCLIVA